MGYEIYVAEIADEHLEGEWRERIGTFDADHGYAGIYVSPPVMDVFWAAALAVGGVFRSITLYLSNRTSGTSGWSSRPAWRRSEPRRSLQYDEDSKPQIPASSADPILAARAQIKSIAGWSGIATIMVGASIALLLPGRLHCT